MLTAREMKYFPSRFEDRPRAVQAALASAGCGFVPRECGVKVRGAGGFHLRAGDTEEAC